MVKRKISEKEMKHKARRFSIKEGLFASARVSVGDRFIAPFAIAINTNNSLVALLTSISGLVGPLTQIYGSKLMEKKSRKKIVLRTVFLESLIWLPLILLAILYYKGILTSILPFILFFFFTIFSILANISVPAWFSWMGDLVDEKYRGRWFSKRNLLTGFTAFVLSILASIFLDSMTKRGFAMFGFATLFFIAFATRLWSWKIFKKQYEPKFKVNKKDYFSLNSFIKNASKNNFGRFSIFVALLNLVSSITGPLVAIYLLRFLEFTYLKYMVVSLAGTLASLLILRMWGEFSDVYGNYRILLITSLFIPIVPILWILNTNVFYLILIPSLISGISWVGFHLAATNFIYDNVGPKKRGIAVSYYSILNGIGIAIGAGIGAFLIKYVTIANPIMAIFIFGSIMRMIVVFFGITKIKETRKTKRLSSNAITNIILKDTIPTITEGMHEITNISGYLAEK